MLEGVIQQVEQAIAYSKSWAETGWSAQFGNRQTDVSSLLQAKALPKNAVYRLEALNYWNQVKLNGHDCAESGIKALHALKQGNVAAAHDALYYCQFIEKPFAESTNTWLPLYEAVKEKLAAK